MSLVLNYTTAIEKPDAIIDSNILVYTKRNDDLKKRDISIELILNGFSGKKKLGLTNQNLSEFSRVMVEKYSFDPKLVSEEIDKLIFGGKLKILDSWHINEINLALDIQKKFKIHFWDAKLAATMISNGVTTIYTENVKDLKKVKGIKVINPFVNKKRKKKE